MVTTIDWTAAWLINSTPASSRIAADIASATTTTICHSPRPKRWVNRSAIPIPTEQPMLTSATRRSRWPYDVPRQSTAATGAKNGSVCPNTAGRDSQATAGRDAHCPIIQALARSRRSRAAARAGHAPRPGR